MTGTNTKRRAHVRPAPASSFTKPRHTLPCFTGCSICVLTAQTPTCQRQHDLHAFRHHQADLLALLRRRRRLRHRKGVRVQLGQRAQHRHLAPQRIPAVTKQRRLCFLPLVECRVRHRKGVRVSAWPAFVAPPPRCGAHPCSEQNSNSLFFPPIALLFLQTQAAASATAKASASSWPACTAASLPLTRIDFLR